MLPMILAALENDEDRALMEELYLRHHRLMYAQALRVLNDSHAAEDAVSSALEALIRKISLLRDMDGNKRKAYIVITVRHAAIDIYRRHSRETVTEDEFLEQIPSDSRVEDRLLESAGVDTVEKLCAMTMHDLGKVKGIGGVGVVEIMRALSEIGMKLRL